MVIQRPSWLDVEGEFAAGPAGRWCPRPAAGYRHIASVSHRTATAAAGVGALTGRAHWCAYHQCRHFRHCRCHQQRSLHPCIPPRCHCRCHDFSCRCSCHCPSHCHSPTGGSGCRGHHSAGRWPHRCHSPAATAPAGRAEMCARSAYAPSHSYGQRDDRLHHHPARRGLHHARSARPRVQTHQPAAGYRASTHPSRPPRQPPPP